MQLYIGGYAQGKLAYVQEKLKGQEIPVVNDLHLWVKQLLQEGKPAEEIVLQYYKEHPDCIFICDEIGNGIVPMEKQEREYRERVGRLLIRLAGEAERKVQCSSEKKSALLECMSNLTANEMFTKDGMKSEEEVVEKIVSEIQTLSQKLDNLVIVTNNVFEDGVIYDAGTMEYLRALGRINAALAHLADRVAEVVVGIPVELKG